MRGTWWSETTLREHKNGGPAWTRRLWRPVLDQLKPDRLPPGACTSRRRRAAAHVERDGRRPAGGHVRSLGVGARHRAVGRDAGGRQLHLVAARGELTS